VSIVINVAWFFCWVKDNEGTAQQVFIPMPAQ